MALLGSAQQLWGQEKLPLNTAVEIALEKNFDIRIAQNNAAIARNNHSFGEAGMLPGVMLSSESAGSRNNVRQEFINGNVLENPSADQQSLNTNVMLNWTIFDGMAMFTNYRRLGELEKMGELQARAAIEQVVADLTMTYYEVVQRRQQLFLAEKSLSISAERMQLADERYQLGSSSRLEYLQARVDYNADRSLYLSQSELYSLSKIELNKLLGRDALIDFEPTDSLPITQPVDFDLIRRKAENDNAWLQMAGLNKQVAELNRKLANQAMMPRIDLMGGYHVNRLESEAGFLARNQNRGLDFGLRASVNIFDGFRQQRQRQQSRIMSMNADLEMAKQEQEVLAGISATYTAFENNRILVEMEAENLEVARQNLEIAQERYRLGALPAIELREAQRQLVSAESRLIQARFLLMVNRTELLRLSGQLLD